MLKTSLPLLPLTLVAPACVPAIVKVSPARAQADVQGRERVVGDGAAGMSRPVIVVGVSVPVLALRVAGVLDVEDVDAVPSVEIVRLPPIPSTVPGAGAPDVDRIVAVAGIDGHRRAARNLADGHGVALIRCRAP